MDAMEEYAKPVSDDPVYDVRVVRLKLSRETGHDIDRPADRARQVTDRLWKELGFRRRATKKGF